MTARRTITFYKTRLSCVVCGYQRTCPSLDKPPESDEIFVCDDCDNKLFAYRFRKGICSTKTVRHGWMFKRSDWEDFLNHIKSSRLYDNLLNEMTLARLSGRWI